MAVFRLIGPPTTVSTLVGIGLPVPSTAGEVPALVPVDCVSALWPKAIPQEVAAANKINLNKNLGIVKSSVGWACARIKCSAIATASCQ